MYIVLQKVRNIILQPNRINKIALLCIVIVTLISCTPTDTLYTKNVQIIFPDSDITVELGEKIVFEANINAKWTSSIDGSLPAGKRIQKTLTLGKHIITAFDETGGKDSINITIVPLHKKENYFLEVQGHMPSVVLPEGTYAPYIVSLFNKESELSISWEDGVKGYYSSKFDSYNKTEIPIKRGDISIWSNISKRWYPCCNLVRSFDTTVRSVKMGDERIFHMVALTENQDEENSDITATCIYSTNKVNVWVDNNTNLNEVDISGIINNLENIIIPRHLEIWGKWKDVDENGKLSILLTPRFNQARTAIGLFNPADFYQYSDNPHSETYNPKSNMMDIIYAGIPETDGKDSAFIEKSITATIAHEMQHLTSFSHVYKQHIALGQEEPKLEKVFLEEGLAHLAENLAGFGMSGGNMAFVAVYLSNTQNTSLSSYSTSVYTDSVERRGGMALLLSWLFWEKGGIEITEDGIIRDCGGISFLQNVYASFKRGWPRIEEAFGKERKEILLNFANFLDKDTNNTMVFDADTGEPLTIDPYFGSFSCLNRNFVLDGPYKKSLTEMHAIPPCGILYGNIINVKQTTRMFVNAEADINRVFLSIRNLK